MGKGGGERGEARRALSPCHAALPAPPPGLRSARQRSARQRPGAWGRGSAGSRESPAVHGAPGPPLGSRGSEIPGISPRRAMEPSHKDPETAAAVGTAADPRGASSSSGVVVQVREKKGPLRAAIPYMPFPVAVLCLFLNTFVPGLGKNGGPRSPGQTGGAGELAAPAGRWPERAKWVLGAFGPDRL